MREDGYLGTRPQHDPARTRELIKQLRLGSYGPGEPASFERGIYPFDKRLYLGAYDGAAVIGMSGVTEEFLAGETPEMIELIGKAMPGAKVLAIGLGGSAKQFGYAWFEGGKLMRARAGAADKGVTLDVGKPMEAEKALLGKLIERDGEKYYVEVLNGEPSERAEEDIGEELVFAVTSPLLGCGLNEFPLSKLGVEAFREKTGWLGRFFGK